MSTARFSLPAIALSSLLGASAIAQDAPVPLERSGTFVPAGAAQIELWPAEYRGELLFLEVTEHGTFVNQGDVIARLDTQAIDKMLRDAEVDLHTAELNHASAVTKAKLDGIAARSARDASQRALDQARRSLEGWEKFELEFKKRQEELSVQYSQHGIDDQEDELKQLEAMYREDELTDATEEIVLRRSRRDLARTKFSQKLNLDQRQYDKDYSLPIQSENKRLAVKQAEEALERLIATQEHESLSREDGLKRSDLELAKKRQSLEKLRQDRGLFEIKSPAGGLLLHGSPEDYRPGKSSPRHRRGSQGSIRSTLFTVAQAERLNIALDIPESKLLEVKDGMAVEVRPVCTPERVLVGRLVLERFPSPQSAGGPENLYLGTVEFTSGVAGLLPGMRATVKAAASGTSTTSTSSSAQ